MTVYFALYGLCAVFTLAMYLRCKDEKEKPHPLLGFFRGDISPVGAST